MTERASLCSKDTKRKKRLVHWRPTMEPDEQRLRRCRRSFSMAARGGVGGVCGVFRLLWLPFALRLWQQADRNRHSMHLILPLPWTRLAAAVAHADAVLRCHQDASPWQSSSRQIFTATATLTVAAVAGPVISRVSSDNQSDFFFEFRATSRAAVVANHAYFVSLIASPKHLISDIILLTGSDSTFKILFPCL